MRVSELSRVSGVPVATIKYYLREGLLPRGETTSPNQARYDETHVRRLQLIRALVEVGSMPVAVIKEVLDAIDDPDVGLHEVLGAAVYPVSGGRMDCDAEVPEIDGAAELDALIAERGWHVHPGAPARATAAEVLVRMRELGLDPEGTLVRAWADAAERAAAGDLAAVERAGGRERAAEVALLGTVIGDTMLGALRRLAQESRSAELYGS
ncbi:MerR family transcriptional regulator [Pseudonocardia phyllosphaerae]|uniref:MerR family transcriptional regulator n=1 Tax=Pseudonocardia phyllosphaerae TaxID=3390502 RepID=UPI00397B6BE5